MPLLERDEPIEAITAALRGAEAGAGGSVFLIGPAGIGKTAIVNLVEELARTAGFSVGGAVGSPMEAELPFGLISQAIVALGGSDVEDVVELERLGGQPARFYRTFRWLSRLAARKAVLLALDDLHWADRDSLDLLGFLSRRLAGARILVVGSLRPEPGSAQELAEDLAQPGQARLLRLDPLSLGAADELLERIAGEDVEHDWRERAWRACGGSPLLLELAAWTRLRGSSLPLPEDDHGSVSRAVRGRDEPGSPGSIAAPLLLARFVGLGREEMSYLRGAAIFGVRFHPALAGALGGLAGARVDAVHGRLVRARIVEDMGARRARFVHPLFGQLMLDSLTTSERETLHAKAFALLVDAGEADALAAEHAVAAGLTGDPLAVEVATRAGRTAIAQGALQAACNHLAHAVDLADSSPDGQLLLDYASALAARGRLEDAEGVCGELLARADLASAMRAHALALQARASFLAGRPEHGEALYEDAVSAAALVDVHSEASILLDAVLAGAIRSPLHKVLPLTARALAILPESAPLRRPLAFMDAYTKLLLADPSGVELLLQEAERLVRSRRDEDYGWAWTLTVQALNMLKLVEGFDRATPIFERRYAEAIEDGAPVLVNSLAGTYSDVLYRLGRPRDALALVDEAIALSGTMMAPWMDIARAVNLHELGLDGQARTHIEALRTFLASTSSEYAAVVSLWLDVFDARAQLAGGEPQSASATMDHAAQIARLTGFRHPCIVPWAGVGIEAHMAAGETERARVLTDDLEGLSRTLGCRWPQAQAALGRARLAAADGRMHDADEGFAQTLAVFDVLPMELSRAEALVAFGSHLRRSGRPRDARAPLSAALSIADTAGAGRIARSARAELAAAGGRRRRRSEDAAKLTAREERVAALAAEGMTNPQIGATLQIAPKTVGHHLEHIYAKLGIGSRRELITDKHRAEGSRATDPKE